MHTKRSTKKSLTDQAAELVEQVTPHVEAARERIVNDYLPVAQSLLADARDTARDAAQDARAAAQQAAADAEKSTRKSRKKAAKKARSKTVQMAAAAAAAAPVTAPLADRVTAKMEPKRGRKKRVLVLLGLAGLGAFVAKKMRGSGASTPSYTPSYTPPSRPVPSPRPAPVADPLTKASTPPAAPTEPIMSDPDAPAETVDRGGAFLDEAVADAAEEPQKVTTPDQPASVEDVADIDDPGRA
jgi:hypothetical protein